MIFEAKFIDGTPVPDDYLRNIAKLISAACESDPGESNEPISAPAVSSRAQQKEQNNERPIYYPLTWR